jgi:signal peptidase I
MSPALTDGDRLLLSKSYTRPTRGDIVVFFAPDDVSRQERVIKRVVAIPGDSVHVEGGIATVNGVVEDASRFIIDPTFPVAVGPLVVPANSVFVLGDNRLISFDSRLFGPLPLTEVVGKVVFIWAPLHHFGPPR